jgi:uncharacterized protein (TIGR02391 family)
MPWDDIQLLRVIDAIEERHAGAALINWVLLAQDQRLNELTNPYQDQRRLARELILARNAGYVELEEDRRRGGQAGPTADAGLWLQSLLSVRLTAAGRDRARGRVVYQALPDPDEDDGRLIAGATLEEMARSIARVYDGYQLPTFLKEAGVSDDFIPAQFPESDQWSHLHIVLKALDQGGSAARRELRTLIGGWLDRRFPNDPSVDERRRIVTQLARQGWHIKDGRIVVGERVLGEPQLPPPTGREARVESLHERIRRPISRFIQSGHIEVAILEAYKAVNLRVKSLTTINDDGKSLMSKALRPNDPKIVLADTTNESGYSIQDGFHLMFMGAISAFRNPPAHELFERIDEDEAFEALGFASLLMRRLDDATTHE